MNLHHKLVLGCLPRLAPGFLVLVKFRAGTAVLFLDGPQLCLIFVAVFHKIHLILVERRILELQIHGLVYILSKAEQQHDFIAGTDACVLHSCRMIQLRQLINPFFFHLSGCICFQRTDELIHRRILRFQDEVP